MSLVTELEAYLHAHIPTSAYMGARVVEATEERVTLSFPLGPNINHRQTVFGGSESSAAILCAWSLLWVRLREHQPRPKLVIRSNSMEYTRPIDSEFTASTLSIDAKEWSRFLLGLERRGKGRLQIRAVVSSGEHVCGEFTGAFVALS